jgi:Cys-tRNA(Pro)/Cys-tRNA(Cys) deacylase
MKKTNAVRILEKNKITFQTFEYQWSEDDLSAEAVAAKINAPIEQVFKTLVARGNNNGIAVFVIPGNKELSLKKAAAESGNKKMELIQLKELLPLTGYQRGGCSPIGMKKEYPTFIDKSALDSDAIYVSAGSRGMQVLVNPNDLLTVTSAAAVLLT